MNATIDLQGNKIQLKQCPHSKAQIAHACQRASERYGFEFTPGDYSRIRMRMIRQFEDQTGIVFLERQTPKRSRFAIWHGGEWLPIVYDKGKKTIVTFLPKTVLRQYKRLLPW